MTTFDLDSFVRGYMTCALWSSTACAEDGNNCTPLDENYSVGDIAPECAKAMREVCADFAEANQTDLLAYCENLSEDTAGGDFWLTRNGHGAGFWDQGVDALGERLSDAAKVYGSVDLYPGCDGLIYGETA